MRLVRLELLTTRHSSKPLRTQEVKGLLIGDLQVGKSIVVISSPLEEGFVRTVTTSPIVSLGQQDNNEITVETNNSTYKISFLKE